jgi:PEP-CTERM motif
MNRSALAVIGTVCLAAAALGQGTVIFNNSATGLVDRWTAGSDPIPVPLGHPSDHVQLFYAPVGTPGPGYLYGSAVYDWAASHPGWTAGPTTRLSGTEPGMFNGGIVSLDGIPAGSEASYIVFGSAWGGDLGIQAPGFYFGLSPVFTTAAGADAASAVPLAGTFGGALLQPFTLVPEPGSLSLAALGAMAMLLGRGRRVQ